MRCSGSMTSSRDDGRSRMIYSRALSSEVDTGSREENASKQKIEPRSDTIGTERALGSRCIAAKAPGRRNAELTTGSGLLDRGLAPGYTRPQLSEDRAHATAVRP